MGSETSRYLCRCAGWRDGARREARDQEIRARRL